MSNNKFNVNSINQKGQRDYNEDSIFPNEEVETTLDNLFLVCDGVGGHAKGEIASDLICTQMDAYFTTNQIDTSDEETINAAVKFVETKFDSYILNNPDSEGMASTLTLLHLHSKGATIAHIGDSRVYQFRNGKILFRTKDHSLVQSLFDIGELKSEEEMAQHPRRNEITRALQGASIRKVKADLTILNDIQVGDIFFLCTDGILETFTDEALKTVFAANESIDTIAATISRKCAITSKDNFSAYFVEVNKEYVDTLRILAPTSALNKPKSDEELPDAVSKLPIVENGVIAEKQENESATQQPETVVEKADKTEVEGSYMADKTQDSSQGRTTQPMQQKDAPQQVIEQTTERVKEQTTPLVKADTTERDKIDDELLKKPTDNVEKIEESELKKEVKEYTHTHHYKPYVNPLSPPCRKNIRRSMTIVALLLLAIILAVAASFFFKKPISKSESEKTEQRTNESHHKNQFASGFASFSERVGGVVFNMVAIPGGSFDMGSRYGESDEVPIHRVNVPRFYMCETEVTQALWEAVMGNNPSSFKGGDLPVENVSWDDCQSFIKALNELTGKRYRLLNEYEWEYACRSGSSTPFNTGNNLTTEQANYDGNYPYKNYAQGEYRASTTRVKRFACNAFGLYDMHGNVWESYSDCWHADYTGAPTDDSAWTDGGSSDSELRGGSWVDSACLACRSLVTTVRHMVIKAASDFGW